MKSSKLLSCLMALLLVCNLSACSTQESSLLDASSPVTITFWHYYGEYVASQLNIIVDQFNETVGLEHGVIVETVAKSNISDLESQLTEAAQGVAYAAPMPDIFLAYPDKITELQKLDCVSDLSLFLDEEDTEKIIDAFLQSGYINDQQVMLPVVKSTELLYLNDTHWTPFAQAYGYTYDDLATWEQLLVVARDYQRYTDDLTPDIEADGKALFGMDSLENFVVTTSMQLGTDIFDAENNTAVLDLDKLEQIFTLYAEAMSLGYFDSVGQFRTDDIRSGDIIAFVGSSASFAYIPDWVEEDGAKVDISWVALPYPYFAQGTPYVLSQGAGVAISTNSEQSQEASALFLNYFLDYNVDFALSTGYAPVTTDFIQADLDLDALLEPYGLEENEEAVYQLIINQIQDGQLYQTTAFDGSYTVRSELAELFEQTALACRERSSILFQSGLSQEEVLEQLDLSHRFDATIDSITAILSYHEIPYQLQ